MATDPDKDLTARARSGDVDAFAEIFEKHRLLVYRIACRLTGAQDADDVVMETYLKAWRALPSFRGEAALKTWLCRVARSCALDLLRRRTREDARRAPASGDEAGDETGDPWSLIPDPAADAPDSRIQADELAGQIEQAMAQLSPEHRSVLVLREVDGLSYKELAAACGTGIGTVMSRLFYAKRKLRQVLLDMGVKP